MSKRCFVIQRFDGGRYDSLYEQVFRPAIEKAGFKPYRVDQDPAASIPIENIEREISNADACFAELSEDAPNVWFEVGYSIAREKPLCLVCSKTRGKFPFDIQHRQIIRYPEQPLPKDFEELGRRISDRLASVSANDIAFQQNAEVARALSISSKGSSLRPHELMALTIIFQGDFTGEVTGWTLKEEMERSGFTGTASGLAVLSLKEGSLIEWVAAEDLNGNKYRTLRVTNKGDSWLMDHQHELNLQLERPPQNTNPVYGYSAEGITDDDIPF